MSFLKEYSYSNLSQKKFIYYNSAVTFCIVGFLFIFLSFSLKYYLFYMPVTKIIALALLTGIFAGNLLGRLIFTNIKNSRIPYVIVEVLFIALSASYFLRKYPAPSHQEPLMGLFFISPYLIPVLILIYGIIAGMKIHYLLKISSGDFIDEKSAINPFLTSSLLGLAAGIGFYYLSAIFPNPDFVPAIVSALLLPSLFLLNLSYSPDPIITKQFKDDQEEDKPAEKTDPEELVFSYLNFTYIVIYSYLGYITIMKYFGGLNYIKFSFLAVILILICLGLFIGRFTKISFWHIYSEMAFPLFFLAFIIIINNISGSISLLSAAAMFAPVAILFGFSIYHSVGNIAKKYSHQNRFNIIDISIIIMPIPVLIAMSSITFSYAIYFISIYVIIAINMLLPAIYLMNKNIPFYKKGLVFAFILIFIPLIVFNHLYFKVPLSSAIYANKTENFEALQNTNYNAPYIKTRASVLINGEVIFNISDSIIRNLKRALVPVAIYSGQKPDDAILFIDGNQEFFRNPLISHFKNFVCLNPVPEEAIDYKRLPFSGNQKYVPENKDLLLYLQSNRQKYFTIVDIPNILDQNKYYFKYTREYYDIIKSRLKQGGVYIQTYNLTGCRPDMLQSSLKNIKSSFKHSVTYAFSDIVVVISSDREASLHITPEKYKTLSEFYASNRDMAQLFYSEAHIFSHVVRGGLDDLAKMLPAGNADRLYYLKKSEPIQCSLSGEANSRVIEANTAFFDYLKDDHSGIMTRDLKTAVALDDKILTALKNTELAESAENYEKETALLFELKRLAEYHIKLREYLNIMLSYKEEYYYNAAQRFEQLKKWDDAKKLYTAILNMNPLNFDANYRMGIISVTLQDIESSFKYLQNALRLKNNDGKVLHQMGILYFTIGNYQEAINYLQRALAQKEASASLYLHLGLSFEQLGNIQEAENYFLKASLKDPNDANIQSRLTKIKKDRDDEKDRGQMKEQKNELDAEVDEKIPLPINKSAYDFRLKDEELKKYKQEGAAEGGQIKQ